MITHADVSKLTEILHSYPDVELSDLSSVIVIKLGSDGGVIDIYFNYSNSDDYGKLSGYMHLPNSEKGQIMIRPFSDEIQPNELIEPYYAEHDSSEYGGPYQTDDTFMYVLETSELHSKYLYVGELLCYSNYVYISKVVPKGMELEFISSILTYFNFRYLLPMVSRYINLLEGYYA